MYPVVTKKITFYENFYNDSLKLAQELGLSYQDYIRYLITQDLRRSKRKDDILIRESKARFMVRMIQDMKKGEYREINDLEKALQDLLH